MRRWWRGARQRSCDLRIAADDTVFSIPEVDLGIPLAWGGIPRLVREIGPAMTRELVLTCRPFDADEARSIGFVNRVVPRADLESTVDELAEHLARKAPNVVRTTKRQVNEALDAMSSTSGSWADADLLSNAVRDPEARAAAQAYLARRSASGNRSASTEQVGGDVVEQRGGEAERLDVDALVVAVEPGAVLVGIERRAEQTPPRRRPRRGRGTRERR